MVFLRYLLRAAIALALALAAVFWILTQPSDVPEQTVARQNGDAKAGALVFAAAGCASCHLAPDNSSDTDSPMLSGGKSFPTEFGRFYAPNISSDTVHGIGDWSFADFARAMTLGVSPDGTHYYPAFPYTSYTRMTHQDLADLFAYMRDLPASQVPTKDHELSFPISVRRTVGLWKSLYMPEGFFLAVSDDPSEQRGRYLVEALAHCAECHTPRDALGGLDRSRWMQGAPDPAGTGRIPGLTSDQLDWSDEDLIVYFETGLTPDYDSVSGDMALVVDNLAKLPRSDLAAIVAYLKALP